MRMGGPNKILLAISDEMVRFLAKYNGSLYLYMQNKELFALGLGLKTPWRINSVKLEGAEEDERGVLHIYVDYPKGSRFEFEGESYSVYDHQQRTWQHLNFFEHECYIHARVPRVKTTEGKVKLITVPWSNKGSSFTLKFEQDVLNLAKENMTATGVGRRYGISGKTVFRILQKYVSHALATQDLEDVEQLSVDETSSKKGHNYFTIMADRLRKKVVGVGVGKDKEAYAQSLIDIEVRGGTREKVKTITMDMSRSYISATEQLIPQADIVFDRFHLAKRLNKAVDQIRRQDQKEYTELKNTRYLWLKNNENLTEKQSDQLKILQSSFKNIGTAYKLKEQFRFVLDEACNSRKLKPLNAWIKIAWESGLEPIMDFVNLLHRHWYGIKTYFKKLVTNAYAERVNLKIQEIKRLARGYANTNNFITMIYFHLGGLNLKPTIFD